MGLVGTPKGARLELSDDSDEDEGGLELVESFDGEGSEGEGRGPSRTVKKEKVSVSKSLVGVLGGRGSDICS